MKNSRIRAARCEVVAVRQNAAVRKRAAGDPRNPRKAKPGRENEFFAAAQSVRNCDLMLALLQQEERRIRMQKWKPIGTVAAKAVDKVLDVYIGTGITVLATVGFGAAAMLIGAPEPVAQAAGWVGVVLAIAKTILPKDK